MSLTPSDIAHHLATIRAHIEDTERVIAECKDALSRASTLTNGDVVDNARKLAWAAQDLRYWLARRLKV